MMDSATLKRKTPPSVDIPVESHVKSRHRDHRARLGMLSGLAVRAISAVTVLGSIKLALAYLGNERFAVWTMITSILGMLTFADLGIVNALTSKIALSAATDDRSEIRSLISSAFYLLSAIACCLVALYWLFLPHLMWAKIFHLSSSSNSKECGSAVTLCFTIFALCLPLGITQKVRSGYQENHINNFFIIPGNLIALVGVYVSIRFNLGLACLCGCLVGGPAICLWGNAISLFLFQRPWALPRLQFVSRAHVGQVSSTGLGFAVLQAVAVSASQMDSLVLTHVIGPVAVTIYALPSRLYQFLPSLLGTALASLWPAYSDAIACGDRAWAYSVLRKSILLSVCLNSSAGVFLLFLGRYILNIWVGPKLNVPEPLWIALTIYTVVYSASYPLSYFLNGLQIIRPQVVFGALGLLLNLLLSVVLTRWIGISGVVWGTVAYLCLAVLIPNFLLARRALTKPWQVHPLLSSR